MTLEAVTTAGRLAAESLMADACTVKRQTGTTYNSATYSQEPVFTTQYTGKCRVQMRALTGLEEDAGETEHGVARWEVQLPVAGTETVKRGDVVTVTAATLDSALAGKQFTVTGPHTASHKTSRRLPVSALVD